MLLKLNSGGNFVPAPAGFHPAVLVDVVDLGEVETQWGKKRQVRLVWEIDKKKEEDGRRFTVSKKYTASINEKSTLRKDLKAMRGHDLTDREIKIGLDLENLLGYPCFILVSQEESKRGDGRIYANVQSLTKVQPGQQPLAPSGEYVRAKDREGYVPPSERPSPSPYAEQVRAATRAFEAASTPPPASPPVDGDDDDVPF